MHDMTKFRVANVSIGTIMLIFIVNEFEQDDTLA